ncbi:hypothetical protein ACF07B_35600 [Streptomyces sp. NPDC015532]|uniref:hypothetical protein n=1 Tax=Streptomyces sp. NPDC015532 TaxID=3364960 RepID=UPI0036F574CF
MSAAVSGAKSQSVPRTPGRVPETRWDRTRQEFPPARSVTGTGALAGSAAPWSG